MFTPWNIDNTEIQVTLKNSAEVKTDIEAFTAGGISQKRQWGRRDFLKDRNVKSETDTITFCVGMMPLILKGDFSNVKILSTKPVAYNALHTQKQLPRIMYSVPRTPFESDAQDFSYNTILPWQLKGSLAEKTIYLQILRPLTNPTLLILQYQLSTRRIL
ncbi:MAG: hypothetical protein ACLUKN_05590 [Bacilli bacterium]